MTKAEFCRRVADFNAAIYDTEKEIADIESRLFWDDDSKRDWYLEKIEKAKAELEDLKQRLDAFTSEFGDVFYT